MSVTRKSDIDALVRAFWRRIEPYKDQYGKELPESIPIEFSASMNTALSVLDHQMDGEALRLIELSGVNIPVDDALKIIKAGYRLVAESGGAAQSGNKLTGYSRYRY